MISEKEADDKILNWRLCDIMQLVNHFHQIDYGLNSSVQINTPKQFVRLDHLYLKQTDIQNLFAIRGEIHSVHIEFGLDKDLSSQDNITFRPLIKVWYKNIATPFIAEFQHATQESANYIWSEIIPDDLKDALCANWMELDNNLLDDVFMARIPTKETNNRVFNSIQRVYGYHYDKHVNDKMYSYLTKYALKLTQFFFFLGVDLNKAVHTTQFTFVPIFGLVFNDGSESFKADVYRHGLRGASTKTTNEDIVYFEYSKPCPSTCGDVQK